MGLRLETLMEILSQIRWEILMGLRLETLMEILSQIRWEILMGILLETLMEIQLQIRLIIKRPIKRPIMRPFMHYHPQRRMAPSSKGFRIFCPWSFQGFELLKILGD